MSPEEGVTVRFATHEGTNITPPPSAQYPINKKLRQTSPSSYSSSKNSQNTSTPATTSKPRPNRSSTPSPSPTPMRSPRRTLYRPQHQHRRYPQHGPHGPCCSSILPAHRPAWHCTSTTIARGGLRRGSTSKTYSCASANGGRATGTGC
jgi:hypothetical protein